MKLLAVDTATNCCGVAIADDDEIVASVTLVSGLTHSRRLLSVIHDIMDKTGLTVADMDGFAVTLGPGSFTGLRIGISTVKGLAVALRKPVAGVSTLEAIAWQFHTSSMLICALIDARKGEVYTSRYRFKNGKPEIVLPECVLPPEQAIAGIKEPCIFAGPGVDVCREAVCGNSVKTAVIAPSFQKNVPPGTVACLGIRNFKDGMVNAPDDLAPVYIRKPDAVLNKHQIKI
ncbi:MAG: tRNA (adenosine(37)-N6)-threonylcarbamoyltransferase complex dimerization subunit type 1 TsaB [Desulfococcus sp. 4484_241]|nr:MAG: tRNA (adenosine(37)-N6)-threonylcarbamoyltransferase complex dimerization subunit type 1 TsaB [Desulfococcus sp. 4484_241]